MGIESVQNYARLVEHTLYPALWPRRGLPDGEPLYQNVLDTVCQGLVDLVFLETVYESVRESNAGLQDKPYLDALNENMREFARCMHVFDTALSQIADGKDPGIVLKENDELKEWYEEQAFVNMVTNYKKGIVDHQRLGKAIEKWVSRGFNGRISLWDRQFVQDLEAKYPCDFKTSAIGLPIEAGEGKDGRQRYCFVLARESTLGKPLEELTVRDSGWVRSMGVREELRPHVEKVERRFETMAPWQTPTLKRVDQMVSRYAPSRLGKKNLPPVKRP